MRRLRAARRPPSARAQMTRIQKDLKNMEHNVKNTIRSRALTLDVDRAEDWGVVFRWEGLWNLRIKLDFSRKLLGLELSGT